MDSGGRELSNWQKIGVNKVEDLSPVIVPSFLKKKRLEGRISEQPGFVLHSYPYKETSLLIDVFTRDYGRIILVAKGAKRPYSKLRGVLQTFQPLSFDWSGRAEVRTLVAAEWVGGGHPLEKSALLCGFYLNELLIKLLARDDPHVRLFHQYVQALNQLAHDTVPERVLRKFEYALLREIGVAAEFSECTRTRSVVLVDQQYVVDPEQGTRLAKVGDTWPRVMGKTLLDMRDEQYLDVVTQTESKRLMRFLLTHFLEGKVLNTREILKDLMRL